MNVIILAMYDMQQATLITQAVERVYTEMHQHAPFMADQTLQWMKHLAGSEQPADYFNHPRAFSFLLLPWWAENSLTETPDLEFQSALAYASVNAYYYIRLMDNLMDGTATVEARLLPVTVFFFMQIEASYQRYFERQSPFWQFLESTWLRQSEATIHDDSQSERDEAHFVNVVTQKVCAANIPIAAVFYRYQRPELIPTWTALVDKLAQWHLMQQDMFDWHKDLKNNSMTYFLSEAKRRKQPDEDVAVWVVREGMEWGFEQLRLWMSEIKQLAATINYPPLIDYLDRRLSLLFDQREKTKSGLRLLSKLAGAK